MTANNRSAKELIANLEAELTKLDWALDLLMAENDKEAQVAYWDQRAAVDAARSALLSELEAGREARDAAATVIQALLAELPATIANAGQYGRISDAYGWLTRYGYELPASSSGKEGEVG